MKLSQVSHHGNVELALWRGRDLFSLRNIAPRLSLSDLLGASGSLRNDLEQRLNRAHSQDILDPEQLIFLPPLPETSKILCAGLNYQSHATEVAAPVAEFPNFFTRFTDTLVGHGQALRIPANSQELDYEGELAVVIGKTCYGPLTENQALDAVSGYTIFNDASVRNFQFRASQWTLGKNFPATGGCGPVLVSADELPLGAKGLNLHTLNRWYCHADRQYRRPDFQRGRVDSGAGSSHPPALRRLDHYRNPRRCRFHPPATAFFAAGRTL